MRATKVQRSVRGPLLLVIQILIGCMAYGQNNMILQTDFEGPSMSIGWDGVESCCSYTMTPSTTYKRTGRNSLRIELRKSDPELGGNRRAELTDNSYPIPHETNRRWWSFSNYLPAEFGRDSVHEILAQWHYRATNSNVSASPPLSLQIYKGDWIVELRYDSVDINIDRGANIKLVRFNLGPWQRGVWNDWVFNYGYSPDNDGYLKIWKNGQLLIDYKGKSYYRGSYDPFFKVGMYRWVWGSTWPAQLEQSVYTSRVYYLDNVRIGNQSAVLQDFQIPDPVPTNISPIPVIPNKQTIALPTNTATIRGTGSVDPDGTIASYEWFVESGPNMPTLGATNVADLKVSGMIQGLYVFRLTVTDNLGAKSHSRAEVEITSTTTANKLPVPVVGATRFITLPVNSLQLSAAGSADPDGTIASYQWSQESGPFNAIITNANTTAPTISALQKGSYYFKLKVTDNAGAFTTTYQQVYVDGVAALPNVAPIANADSLPPITLPSNQVTLNGSKSFDTDGTITGYSWSQVSGPSSATITNGNTATATASNLVAGTYIFSMIITDNSGLKDTATSTVLVNPVPAGVNLLPVSVAGPNQTFAYFYNTVTLRGNASYDPDGTIVSYKWTQDSGPALLISTPDSAITLARNLTVSGVYVFRLTVTDNLGARTSSVVTVTITPAVDGVSGIPQPNLAPVANPGQGSTFVLQWNTITLNGVLSNDPDGTIASYQWIQESGPALNITTADSVYALARNPVPGTFVFRLIVKDNKGYISSSPVSYTILPPVPVNIKPTANAGSGQTFQIIYNTIRMSGALSSDSDGVITRYQWTQESGPALTMSFPDSVVNIARNIVVGTFVFRLVVTDNMGATDTARLTVNVLPVATAARASSGNAPMEQSVAMAQPSSEQWKWGSRSAVIYPNPVRNELVLKLNNSINGRGTIQVFTMQGRLVHKEYFDKNSSILTRNLSVAALPAGNYTIQVSIGQKPVLTRQFTRLE